MTMYAGDEFYDDDVTSGVAEAWELPSDRSPQCAECREVYAGTRVHHVTTSAWHRQWSERDWRVRNGL